MKQKTIFLALVTLIVLLAVGCGSSPTPAPTLTPQVITVIVTATPLSATATPAQPSLTPMPTVAITTTAPVTTTTIALQPTKPAVALKPTATKTPTRVAATTTALPMKYGAPILLRPKWTDDQKDERRFDSDSVEFVWRPVEGLGSGECYLLNVTSEPTSVGTNLGTKSDSFLVKCADQPRTDDEIKFGEVRFTLVSPKMGGPNYSSIKLDTNEMWVTWTITVVKNLGQCEANNQYHCKTQPISPPRQEKFLFKAS